MPRLAYHAKDAWAIPAYGRDYDSAEAVLADWHAGKDFKNTFNGLYFSIRGSRWYTQGIWIRYNNGRDVVRVG